MITLTAEIICDKCRCVVATGEPTPTIGDNHHWIWSAFHHVEAKAKSLGASFGIETVTCAECLEKEKGEK